MTGLLIASLHPDRYIIDTFRDADDGLPAERIEQANNPSYFGCAFERRPLMADAAIPSATLRTRIDRDATDLRSRLGLPDATLVVWKEETTLLGGERYAPPHTETADADEPVGSSAA